MTFQAIWPQSQSYDRTFSIYGKLSNYQTIITFCSLSDPFNKKNSGEKQQDICDQRNYGWKQKETQDGQNWEENLFFGSYMNTAHEGKALSSWGHCSWVTVLTWRGSLHILCKCWWGLDMSLSLRETGWLCVYLTASLCLACVSWPSLASFKTRCPGWSTPREGLSTQIYGFTYVCDILTISIHLKRQFTFHKWKTSLNQWQGFYYMPSSKLVFAHNEKRLIMKKVV